MRGTLQRRVVVPLGLRYYQWRGDPLARLFSGPARRDPYPLYAEMRDRGLVRSRIGVWATARHGSVATVLKDQRFSSNPNHFRDFRPMEFPAGDPRGDLPSENALLLSMDPPDHTRIRRLVGSAFSPRAVAALEPWIQAKTDELLAQVDGTGFDVIDDLAFPLPMAVICHMLGVPHEDREQFRGWGRHVAASLDPSLVPDLDGPSMQAQVALNQYFTRLVADRRSRPGDDLLTALIAAEEDGDRLSTEELLATCFLVLVAGFETTVNLIGNGTVALIHHPEQWARLRADPDLVGGAVEELLRFDSPVQLTSRNATEDIELDGVMIPKGDQVIVMLGGANRDAEVFDRADRLDVTRPDANRHLSFSHGLHHCLGAALARMEGRVALRALVERFPGLTLTAEPVRRPFMVLRGFEHIPARQVAPVAA